MRKTLMLLTIILALVPLIFGVVGREDTPIFTDETPGQLDTIGSFSLVPAQYSFNDYAGHLILRMGSWVREFDGRRAQEEWSWMPGRVVDPLNPTSIDAIDFNGDRRLNDVVYISKTKEVTIREGEVDEESKSDILWTQDFVDNVYSIRSTDFDGDGRVDDLIVAAGQRIYALKPSTNTTFISFSIDVVPYIIAPADLDNDGKKNDIVIGTWFETSGTGGGTEIQNGIITVYYDNGNRGWRFPDTPLDEKVTYIAAYDRDSDGSEDDVIVIFTDVSDPNNPDSDLYIVSAGSQVFFNSNVIGASPADYDGDGNLDDFILSTKTQVSAYNSELKSIEAYSNFDFNTTLEQRTPTRFLGVASLSLETDAEGENIFDDIAIFTVVGNEERVIFFRENFAKEEPEPTPTPTPTPSPTPSPTPPPNQAPTATITGISDGTTVQEGSTVSLSASASDDPDGEIVSYQWLVGDVLRETSEEFTLNTQGFSVGSHVITLKVTDDDGEVGVTTITISLAKANVPPIADAGEDVTVKEGSSVSLSAEGSSDPDGEIESYEWSEGGTVFSLEKNVEKNFSVGVHTITLQVIDDEGASSTDTVVVTVEKKNLPPRADAGEDVVVMEGVSVRLSAKGSSDPDGNITSYAWLMPDGKVITKPEFNVTFPVGTYGVLLNITDDKGAVGMDEITVTVKKRPGTLERIRSKYASEIKITLLTLVALTCSVVIFLRFQREKGLY